MTKMLFALVLFVAMNCAVAQDELPKLPEDKLTAAQKQACYRLAKLSSRVMRQVQDYGEKAFRALKLRDYARLDFRLTDDGRLVFIEANPNSDLTPNTPVNSSK